jgi:type II secretory pathway pseudopilin PulG
MAKGSQRGMTLVEVVIAATLGVLVTATVVGFGVYMGKLSKATFSQLKFSMYSKKTIEEIADVIRYAKRIQIQDGGKSLLCTDENNVTGKIYYSDDDNKPSTLLNNRMYYVSNIKATPFTPVMIGRYISPFPNTPIFSYLDRTSAVEIRFRIGDPRDDPGADFNAETGPGPQGMDVRGAFGPRNSYLE